MIRASNLPVLLCIALYERNKYDDTSMAEQIWDYVDDYLGYLPRKLRSAGEPTFPIAVL